jgi:hypothetical protein
MKKEFGVSENCPYLCKFCNFFIFFYFFVEPETSKKPELNANMLFGSDSEDETPADRPRHSEEPNDEYGVNAKTPVDADNSDAGSIKSDVDPNE